MGIFGKLFGKGKAEETGPKAGVEEIPKEAAIEEPKPEEPDFMTERHAWDGPDRYLASFRERIQAIIPVAEENGFGKDLMISTELEHYANNLSRRRANRLRWTSFG